VAKVTRDPSVGCVAIYTNHPVQVLIDGVRVAMTPSKCIELPAGPQQLMLDSAALGVHEEVVVNVKGGETIRLAREY